MAQGGLKKRSEKFSVASKSKSSRKGKPLGLKKGGEPWAALASSAGSSILELLTRVTPSVSRFIYRVVSQLCTAVTAWMTCTFCLPCPVRYIAPKKAKTVKAEKLKKVS